MSGCFRLGSGLLPSWFRVGPRLRLGWPEFAQLASDKHRTARQGPLAGFHTILALAIQQMKDDETNLEEFNKIHSKTEIPPEASDRAIDLVGKTTQHIKDARDINFSSCVVGLSQSLHRLETLVIVSQ